MRICHVVATASGWGGLERHVTELAGAQVGRHEVLVLGAQCLVERLPAGVQGCVALFHQNRHDPRLLWNARKALIQHRPQIIHTHANKATSMVGLLKFFLPRMAHVATLHNTKRTTRVFNGCDAVIAVSRQAGARLTRAHTVIWNAIPTPPEEPEGDVSELPFLDRRRPLALAVGRFVPAKGYDVLIRSLKDVDANLWILGDGPLRSTLEKLAQDAGVSNRVWFAGFRSDVGRLMRLADFMVIASRHEGFPYTLVEMLRRTKPVISTRVGGADEVLPAEWLCPCDDVPALAGLLQRATQLGKELNREFEPVFELASRELNLSATVGKIDTVYQTAITKACLSCR